MAAKKHEVETAYLNSWVETGVYELVISREVAEEMRRQNIDLVDVNHVLLTGAVTHSDMIGSRGLWHIDGETIDGQRIELEVGSCRLCMK